VPDLQQFLTDRDRQILARGVSGGADDDPPKGDPTKDDPPKGDPPKDDPPKDDKDPDWKDHARTWEDRAKADKKRADAAEAELDKLRKATQSEQEKAIAEAKAEGRSEALDVANARFVKAAVITAAAGKLADPSDAAALLDLSDFKVDDDGNVDEKAIAAAIEKLVETKPHLAGKGAGRPSGDGGGGPRGDPAGGSKSMNDLIREKAGRGA